MKLYIVLTGIMLVSLGLVACESEEDYLSDQPEPYISSEINAYRQSMQSRLGTIEKELDTMEDEILELADSSNSLGMVANIEVKIIRIQSALENLDSTSVEIYDRQRAVIEKSWSELETDVETLRLELATGRDAFENAVESRLDELSLELLDVERHRNSLEDDAALRYAGVLADLKQQREELNRRFDSLRTAEQGDTYTVARQTLLKEMAELGVEIQTTVEAMKQNQRPGALIVSETKPTK